MPCIKPKITPELRKRAKAVNFGIVYGISDFALSQDLGITKYQAGEYIRSYKETYSGVDEYLHSTIEEGKELGFVKTLFGRRRYIPELTSSKAMMRAFGERVAMNSPIQGSAADIIKVAMIRVEDALAKSGLDAKLILQVHDELILEVRDDCVEAAAALLKSEMEHAFDALVPLTAEVSCGKTWFMEEDGSLTAKEGETEFSHIPDWFAWEREQVQKQVEAGTYVFEDEVDVYSLPRCWKFEHLGKAKLLHHPETGFVLEGEYNGETYRIQRTPMQTNSLHIEYDYCYIKPFDCVDISTENDSFYCYPTKPNVVTKLAFATEILYQMEERKALESRKETAKK